SCLLLFATSRTPSLFPPLVSLTTLLPELDPVTTPSLSIADTSFLFSVGSVLLASTMMERCESRASQTRSWMALCATSARWTMPSTMRKTIVPAYAPDDEGAHVVVKRGVVEPVWKVITIGSEPPPPPPPEEE